MIIPTTNNKASFIIDEEDLDRVRQYSWELLVTGYIGHRHKKNYKMTRFLLHRFILNAAKGQRVDHINGNPLDNRKSNLRFCNQSQNNMNARLRKTSKSGFKGVSWENRSKKWRAVICLSGNIELGRFESKIEAAKVYNAKALELFGEFARFNVIPEEDSK